MAKLITFTCPDCGKNITASSSERNTRCEHCGKLIHLINHPDQLVDNAKIAVPPRVHVEYAEDVLRIQYSWYKPGYISLLLFSILWNLMALPFIILLPTFFSGDPSLLVHGIFTIILGGMGIFFLSWAIVLLFNQTVIEICGDQLSIRFVPFPWFGRKSIHIRELTSLVCSKHIVDSRNWFLRPRGISFSYTVHEIYAFPKNSSEEFLLVSHLPSTEAAFFIKQMIESAAGID